MRRLILRSFQSPGDVVMLTAAVRDLHAAAPGKFQTDVRTSTDALWEHNPHLTNLREGESGVESLDMHYPLVHQSNQRPYHFLHGYAQYLEERLGLRVPVTRFAGDIHLSAAEKSAPPLEGLALPERFWIIVAGGKHDFTAKWWNPASYQQVVDHFRGKIQFVQCGEAGHWHPPLEGVVNLIGKTTTRQFVRLMYHADGVICPVTFAMHLAAAVETKPGRPKHRPCVVIAGGREPTQWEAYPHHQYLSTTGMLSCCADGGCWKSRCQLVGDGDLKDRRDVCEQPVQITPQLRIPKCLDMISADDVIRRIEMYLAGGLIRVSSDLQQVDRNGKGHPVPMLSESPGQLHSQGRARPLNGSPSAATPHDEGVAVTPLLSNPPNLLLYFPHELSAVIELSVVLRHLRHYHPDWNIDVAVRSEYGGLLRGLRRQVVEPAANVPYGPRRSLNWPDCSTTYVHWPSTRAAQCLFEEFQLTPLKNLCRYAVSVSEESQATARELLSTLGTNPSAGTGRFPVVVLDPQGDDAAESAMISADVWHAVAERIRAQGLVPLWVRRDDTRFALQTSPDTEPLRTVDSEVLAAVLQQATFAVGVCGAPLRIAAAVSTPSMIVWTTRHPQHEFDPAPSVLHCVPQHHDISNDHELARQPSDVNPYFSRHYRSRVWRDLAQELPGLVADQLSHSARSSLGKIAVTVPRSVNHRPSTKPPRSKQTLTTVRFYHGLGDCANFARLIPLYVRRGHRIGVECTPDKALLFRAAGAEIVTRARHEHAWAYPPCDVHTSHGRDHQGSKLGWNISEPPLPNIGDKTELWSEYCASTVRVAPLIPEADRDAVANWLATLPRPIVLLHTKGNTAQQRKSLPDPLALDFYRELLDRCDGTLVLLDWDDRVPRLLHYRVRHLTELPGYCSTERLFALFDQSDLMIGVDSGPLHVAGLSDIPRVGVWMPGHYPARYTLPQREQLNLVLAGHTNHWNRYRRVPWNIVEQPGTEFDPAWLADQSVRMLRAPRYLLPEQLAADVQLQQWIEQWCRGPKGAHNSAYADRHHSFDVTFREVGRRFPVPMIVETGTIRGEEDWGGAGFFTYLAGAFVLRRGGKLHSVDLTDRHCQFARTWTAVFGEAVEIHCQDSVAFLREFGRPIDLLYLDSLDTYQPGHAEHALLEAQSALPWLHAQSLILLDDTFWSADHFEGKGTLAVPWLLDHGWKILHAGYQVLLCRTESAS